MYIIRALLHLRGSPTSVEWCKKCAYRTKILRKRRIQRAYSVWICFERPFPIWRQSLSCIAIAYASASTNKPKGLRINNLVFSDVTEPLSDLLFRNEVHGNRNRMPQDLIKSEETLNASSPPKMIQIDFMLWVSLCGDPKMQQSESNATGSDYVVQDRAVDLVWRLP
jgi:hypothetical protein